MKERDSKLLLLNFLGGIYGKTRRVSSILDAEQEKSESFPFSKRKLVKHINVF